MLSETAAPAVDKHGVPVTTQLRTDLRTVAVDHVLSHPESKARLANMLHVDLASIEALLDAPTWDLQLSLRVLSFLEVPVRVTRA